MQQLRIVTLYPAATEIVYALGLGKSLVGVSDDSDYPKYVHRLAQVVTSSLPQGLSSKQIDNRVRKAMHRGIGVFHINEKLLKKLRPNLILSQELCEVCAIGASDVRKAARILKNPVKTVSLEPESVSDVLENIKLVGSITQKSKAAKQLIQNLSKKIKKVEFQAKSSKKPKVLIIEWLDPIMVAGHWVPEMVALAGGSNLVTKKGEISKRISWREVCASNPDVLIISPCGFDIARTKEEIGLLTSKKDFEDLRAVRNRQIYLIDGNAYLTRPGPRIVNGIEILSEILYPNLFNRSYGSADWQKIRS
jgi:iron complex transport system substrate-binding protein